jgi:hypothetical protein
VSQHGISDTCTRTAVALQTSGDGSMPFSDLHCLCAYLTIEDALWASTGPRCAVARSLGGGADGRLGPTSSSRQPAPMLSNVLLPSRIAVVCVAVVVPLRSSKEQLRFRACKHSGPHRVEEPPILAML